MKKLALTSVVMISVTLLFAHCGYTQTVQQDMVKGIMQAVGPNGLNPLLKTVASQIGQMPEVRDQLIKEVVKSINPDDLKDILTTVAKEVANDPEFKSRIVRVMASGTQPVSFASSSSAPATQASSRIPSALQARLSRASEPASAPNGTVPDQSLRIGARRPDCRDHPSIEQDS